MVYTCMECEFGDCIECLQPEYCDCALNEHYNDTQLAENG